MRCDRPLLFIDDGSTAMHEPRIVEHQQVPFAPCDLGHQFATDALDFLGPGVRNRGPIIKQGEAGHAPVACEQQEIAECHSFAEHRVVKEWPGKQPGDFAPHPLETVRATVGRVCQFEVARIGVPEPIFQHGRSRPLDVDQPSFGHLRSETGGKKLRDLYSIADRRPSAGRWRLNAIK